MDEFFRRTSAWRYSNDIELVEESLEYELRHAADTVVVRVMGVDHQDMPVPAPVSTGGGSPDIARPLAPELMFPDGDVAFDPTASDLERRHVQLRHLPAGLHHADRAARRRGAQVSAECHRWRCRWHRGCLECDCGDWALDEWMWDMFFQDWLDGTLGRLYAMPAKPWSSTTARPVPRQTLPQRHGDAQAGGNARLRLQCRRPGATRGGRYE